MIQPKFASSLIIKVLSLIVQPKAQHCPSSHKRISNIVLGGKCRFYHNTTAMVAVEQRIHTLGEKINKEVLETDIPDVEVCRDLVLELCKESKGNMTLDILEKTKIGKLLTKSIKSFNRHRRTANAEATKEWEQIISDASKLRDEWKTAADQEANAKAEKKPKSPSYSTEPGLPQNSEEYRKRLLVQKKEMYKDPPVMPPLSIEIEGKTYPLPKRDKKTGLLTFTANDSDVKSMLKDFQPNRTPEEVLRAGSFGGTYFRPITSAVTNVTYKAQEVLEDSVHKDWIKGLPMSMLTSKTYMPQINKFGVKCGGSLGMWESSGWIVESDPYGWFQWYCRFYQGRRCSDDARQISRWLKSAGPKGRFRSQLCNKILAAGKKHDDRSISPVIRQTLLHWGLEITEDVLMRHRKRVGR